MQPALFALAVISVLYEIWLVRRRPPALRKRSTRAVLALSVTANAIVIGGWVLLTVRYK